MATLKANAIISEAELEELTQTSFDTAYANALINIASDFIEKFCDRKFIETTFTDEIYDGNGSCELYLKNAPISNVTIKHWDTVNNIADYTFIENDDYIIYTIEGKIYKRSHWSKGYQNYRISYKAGYTLANIPFDLKFVCAKICETMHNNQQKSGISEESIGRYSVSYSKENLAINGIPLPFECTNILNQYRRYNEQ